MFDPERFVEDCVRLRAEGQRALRERLAQDIPDPSAIMAAMDGSAEPGFRLLHRSANLTILDFIWAPDMTLPPHTHEMPAIIGVYTGREDNIFWRRRDGAIEAAGAQSLGPGDIATLGKDIIHSVTNPLGQRTRAIHLYLGDFFEPETPRKEWDHASLEEHDWTPDIVRTRFADAAAREAAVKSVHKR